MFGQLSLSKPGAFSSRFLLTLKNGTLLRQIEAERVPGNSKVLVTHSKKASEGKNRISDAARSSVKHQIFDFAEAFVLRVNDTTADHRLFSGNDICVSRQLLVRPRVTLLLSEADWVSCFAPFI